jgi:hypothetical protein
MSQDIERLFSPVNAVDQPTALPQECHNRIAKLGSFFDNKSK